MDAFVVEQPRSPWGAPTSLVEKTDGSFRMAVDYRRLNAVTRVDSYPIPEIQKTQLSSAKYFSVFDLASGFQQMKNFPGDKKTALNSPSGHYQRTADVVLKELVGQMCHVYIDDIVICGPD